MRWLNIEEAFYHVLGIVLSCSPRKRLPGVIRFMFLFLTNGRSQRVFIGDDGALFSIEAGASLESLPTRQRD